MQRPLGEVDVEDDAEVGQGPLDLGEHQLDAEHPEPLLLLGLGQLEHAGLGRHHLTKAGFIASGLRLPRATREGRRHGERVAEIADFLELLAGGQKTSYLLIGLALLGIGSGFSQQPFFQLWSGELFPTLLRSTAQGLMFAVVRISLGIWSFFVPAITAAGFHTLAWILTGFAIMFITGGLLFSARASAAFSSGYFRLKMLLLLLGGLNVLIFHSTIDRRRDEWDEALRPPLQVRLAGVVSLVLWFAIIEAGRVMAYNL